MKKLLIGLVTIILLTSQASAHSGKTDKKGGHKCSQKSIDKGLCTEYHYHNGQRFANNAIGHKEHMDEHKHSHKNESKPVVTKA